MTLRLGLIGQDIAESLSPRLHAKAMELLDLPGQYDLLPCADDAQVREVLQRLRSGDLTGVNVTAPWKPLARSLCDDLMPVRMRRRPVEPLAVNTLWMREDASGNARLVGAGTDGPGLTDVLFGAGVAMTNARVVLIGAGGAAQAIAADLLEAGARHLTIVNRHEGKALALANWLQAVHGPDVVSATAWGDPYPLTKATLVVQATSVGHPGKPWDPQVFAWLPWPAWTKAVLVDLVCAPRGQPSPWQQLALDAGLGADLRLLEVPVEVPALHRPRRTPRGVLQGSGLAMLAAQASRSLRLWTGAVPDAARMLRALL